MMQRKELKGKKNTFNTSEAVRNKVKEKSINPLCRNLNYAMLTIN